ncbi:MAG: nitrogenase-stabilizing/protective protein NifW [Gloeomargarita sp. DG02_4_bins_56]
MPKTLAEFNQLTDAEGYFEFLEVPYDPKVVNVNRLHILRKFSQMKAAIDSETDDPQVRLERYRSALATAYQVFLNSTSYEQKLFKVFQTPPPAVVLLSDITAEEEKAGV